MKKHAVFGILLALLVNPACAQPTNLFTLAGAKPGEYVLEAEHVRSGPIVAWAVTLAQSPPMEKEGRCVVNIRIVYVYDKPKEKLPQQITSGMAFFNGVTPGDCVSRPEGELIYVDELALRNLDRALSLVREVGLEKIKAARKCAELFPNGLSERFFRLRSASSFPDHMEVKFEPLRTSRNIVAIWFPLANGEAQPEGIVASCYRMEM